MKTNEKIKKNGVVKIIIILTMIVTILILAGLAYAKYVTSIGGQSEVQIAQWNFNVTAGSNQNLNINLADTRIANDSTTVQQGYIGPGTKGQFTLTADATGSEVSVIYNIDLNVSNVPKNLKFYSDSQMKNKVIITDNQIKIEDFIGVNDTKQQKKTIYWSWPFETGVTDYEKNLNDIDDSRYMGQEITLQINVTGKQTIQKPTYLADVASVGDYVAYNANSNGEKTFTATTSMTGGDNDKNFSSSETMKWRVLYIDRLTKTVELMSADISSTLLKFRGRTGYKNSISVLNNICSIYGQGNGANFGRCMVIEDVDQYSSFNKNTYYHVNTNGTVSSDYYGKTKTYSSGVFTMEDNRDIEASESNPVTIFLTEYEYSGEDNIDNDLIYKMIFKKPNSDDNKNYWLASRYTGIYSTRAYFGVRRVAYNKVSGSWLCYSEVGANDNDTTLGVTPVVTLNSSIKTIGQNNEVGWQLDIN